MKINNEVSDVLGNSLIKGNNLVLPEGQLDRKLYMAVNKVLECIGGKWNRKAKAHVFNTNPDEILEQILQSGEYTDAKKEYQFFETPILLAEKLVEMADLVGDELVLEPSAGKGAIARFIDKSQCTCIELNEDNRNILLSKGFNVVHDDFLTFDIKYDVIIANPPFSKQQDIDHVLHMIKLAKIRVVSVMSASILFRSNKKTNDFRKYIESLGGIITALPEKTFSESGTNVNTCVVLVNK